MPKRDKQLEKVLDWARKTAPARDAAAAKSNAAYAAKTSVADPQGYKHKRSR